MATATWNCSKDARVALNGSTSLGSGQSDGLPVGLYSGFLYRSFIGFSYSFSGMTAITSAVLHVKTSSQIHVAFGADPDILVQRVVEGWSEGSANALSGSNAIEWNNMPGRVSSGEAQKDVTTSESTWVDITITDIIQDAFAAGVFYGLCLRAVTEDTADNVTEFYSRQFSTASDAYITVTYTTNTAPNAPTGLAPTGDAVVNSLTPQFTGTFSDPDSGDRMSGYQILVYADDGTTLVWDSGAVSTVLTTAFAKTYSGPALTGNTFYKWKARTKDQDGAWGAYSALQRFKVNSVPSSPLTAVLQSPVTALRTLTPDLNFTHQDPDPSDSQMYAYQLIVEDSNTQAVVWDTGEVTLGTAVVSKTVTYAGPALSWQSTYRFRAKTKDSNGAWSALSSYRTFATQTTQVPNHLNPNNSELADSTLPTLSGTRASSNDSFASVEIEVYASDGTTLVWSSGVVTSGVTASSFAVAVTTPLTALATYKWRVRATGDIGGTSAYSSLQTMVIPDPTSPTATAPIGTGITDTTPDFTFTRSTNFNQHELELYSEDDDYTTAIWTDDPASYTATGSKAVTSGVTLDYGKTYKWRVRVSADGGSNYSDWTGLVQFSMDEAGALTLTAPIDDSWETTTTPTFTGSTVDTITTFRILLYASDQTTLIWDSGDLAGSGTSFSKVYDGSTALTKGSAYFWQAEYDSSGLPSPLAALEGFHINADPTVPTNMSPVMGEIVTTLTPDFKATFADPDLSAYGDTPTEYEVEVYRNSDDTLMHSLSDTTSLVAGENTLVRAAEGTALSFEVEYKFRARYTDSKSAVGPWSSYVVFKPTEPPTTTIDDPVGSTINSPSFTIAWTMTSPASKAQGAYQVRVIRDSDDVVLYDTTKSAGTETSVVLPGGLLVNATDYIIEVTTWDTDDQSGGPETLTVTSDWTAPDAPADFVANQDDATSSVILEWTVSNLLAADFSYYQIYRREQGDAAWTAYATETNQSVVSYTDFFAANDTPYDYKITVFKVVPGDVDLESVDSDIAAVLIDTDVWFVIGADRATAHCFELPVSSETHDEPIQQEVFEPLGSRRKTIVRGKVLGNEGSLEVKWQADEREAAKGYLRYLADNAGPHILKSPFGDLWLVEFGGTSRAYATGGHYAVTLTWIEVA